METPNLSSLPRADPDRIPTQSEGQFSSDSHYEESAPSLNRAQPHPFGGKITAHKTTVGTIVGLYLVALLCSILHYIFFNRLHGSVASGEHARISQSQTTFISLFLVTVFKASLLGSVGICSVQYLWRVLRGQPIALSTVENLFQMRHNPLELFYCQTFISVSFFLAAFTWIVPLATIYPPGALTIDAIPFLLTESVHMSVPELLFDSEFDPLQPENVSRLALFAGAAHWILGENYNQTTPGTVNLLTVLHITRPQPFLFRLSKSVIAAGELVLKHPATLSENSTYILEFMGPQLSCRNVEQFNRTVSRGVWHRFTDLALGIADRSPYMTEEIFEWQITQQNALGASLCQDSQGNLHTLDENGAKDYNDGIAYGARPNGTYFDSFLIETSKTNCTERYVSYTTNITYNKGVRSIQYTMRDIEPQPVKNKSIDMEWEASINDIFPGGEQPRNASFYATSPYVDAAFAASSYLQRSRNYLKERFRYWNAFTIYAAFLETIESATQRACYVPTTVPKCGAERTRTNGSRVAVGPDDCFQWDDTSSVLENSRLNPYRYSTSGKRNSGKSDVSVTEAALNELLTNITMSLMTLDLWTDNINVTATVYRNTYEFSRKINLILPYAICLAFGLLIVGLGLGSLWHNGVPASDGFMQVMMATRGRTEMERLVLKESLVGSEKASQELMGLKVRYGELVSVDAVKEDKIWGFGTVEETVSLRKRN